ncbi:substrate-binding domain-containing protein [Kitasatospora sp. NPDC056783]|uniref:substrate-binding domain-containing protein n=1 Tax=Kitasatospora sp. NPDC056783 TaxID=3345943 RepID=UPI0036BF90B7
MRTGSRLLVAAAAAVLTTALSTGGASADPAVPVAQDIVGVGAGTTQGLMNQLALDYDAQLAARSDTTSPRLYSWDSTGTSTILTKAGATPIARPHGAWAGAKALGSYSSATVDFARVDRGPLVGDQPALDFVVLAKDAVTWAAQVGGNAPEALSPAQLKAIYQCDVTTWNQIDPSKPATAIKPFLPFAGSGTRVDFLKAIGNPTLSPCVQDGPEENQGTDSRLNDPDVVFPYSVGDYVGQTVGGHGTATDGPGGLSLRGVALGPTNTAVPPVVNGIINTALANSAFGRVVYNTFRDAEFTAGDAHGNALRAIFGRSGWICTDATAKADIKSHGFLVTPACGAYLQG